MLAVLAHKLKGELGYVAVGTNLATVGRIGIHGDQSLNH